MFKRIFKRNRQEDPKPLTERAPRTFVPRADFRTIIERAIVRTPFFDLTQAERLKLLDLAEHARQVAYGFWMVDGIGCPVDQCRISRGNVGADVFARAFDGVVSEYLKDSLPTGRSGWDAYTPQILVII